MLDSSDFKGKGGLRDKLKEARCVPAARGVGAGGRASAAPRAQMAHTSRRCVRRARFYLFASRFPLFPRGRRAMAELEAEAPTLRRAAKAFAGACARARVRAR